VNVNDHLKVHQNAKSIKSGYCSNPILAAKAKIKVDRKIKKKPAHISQGYFI